MLLLYRLVSTIPVHRQQKARFQRRRQQQGRSQEWVWIEEYQRIGVSIFSALAFFAAIMP
jgi:hypothetical protein